MRVDLILIVSLFSASAVAIEPARLPHPPAIAAQGDVQGSMMTENSLIAEGVPIDAVLGGDEAVGWVAGAPGAAALGGFDLVSFFESDGPKPGRAEHAAEHHGRVFLFTDRRHRDLFVSAPELYAPAFGGYDPEALARGSLLAADPENWTIHEGRLFVSGSPRLKSEFERQKPEVIKAAQVKWEAVDRMFQDRFFRAHQD
ncbi:MAG: YHS domain-containing (seleno)protein [Parvularculaceae bacterium]